MSLCKSLVVALLCTSLITAIPAQAQEAPPFKRGEVAVYATPEQLPGYTVKQYLPHAGISIVAAEPGREQQALARLMAKGKKAGLNRLATKFGTPDDSLYSFQWHFNAAQAPGAWATGATGSTVTVAVLDTGLASGGPDGIGCEVVGENTYNDASTIDGDGHGTHVSGTIAQATNNSVGVAGLAYESCIMPVKVLSDSGSGTSASIADGIAFAVNNSAQVINMSLGFSARYGIRNDSLIDPQLNAAYNAGVTVVVASGNDGHRKNVSYPAIYPTTIAVGATDFRNNVTRYSNKGEGLDLVAPGGNTARDDNRDGYGDGVLQETRINGSWGYYFFQGTSMASPHVAAAAALLIASGKATTPDAIKTRLKDTALDLGDAGFDSQYGAGLLQVADALLAGSVAEPPPPGACTDADGDGFCSVATGGEDCDDENAAIHPGANDTRGKKGRDGVDNDCDETPDQ